VVNNKKMFVDLQSFMFI